MATMEIFALGFISGAVATKANSGYRVVARVADNIIFQVMICKLLMNGDWI